MPTSTLTYIQASRSLSTLGFSGPTTTVSVNLPGPGGQSGDGFPLPHGGYLTRLFVWDGTTPRSDATHIGFVEGDRLSIYCQNAGANFTVKARLNGTTTNLQVKNVPFNTTLYVVAEIMLINQ